MKRTIPCILAAVLAALAFAIWAPGARTAAPLTPQVASGSLSVALVGAKVFLSPRDSPVDHGVVIISNGKIVAAGSRGKVQVPGGIGILDCTGMYILAGLQNSNVHFTQSEWDNAALIPPDTLASQMQAMFTRYGFTSVMDTRSELENTGALRNRIDSGDAPGPRILTSGSPLYPLNGIPDYLKSSLTPAQLKQLPQPTTAAEAVKLVDERIADGADFITLFTGSRVAKGVVVNMSQDVAKAAAAEAHKHGKLVFAHATNVAGIQLALLAQADVLEHPVEDLRGWRSGYIEQMKIHGMFLIPTLSLFMSNPNSKAILGEVSDFSLDNVHILFGSDAGYLANYDPSEEYVQMEKAGMTFDQVLASLTTEPAQLLGESNIRGKIQAGMDADLVILSRDPQHDIRNLTQVIYTMRQGRFIYSVLNH